MGLLTNTTENCHGIESGRKAEEVEMSGAMIEMNRDGD